MFTEVSEEGTAFVSEAQIFKPFSILASFMLVLIIDLEDGGSMFLRNFGKLLPDYTE
jgi:hypothetical protein